jgi:hypothetical protein
VWMKKRKAKGKEQKRDELKLTLSPGTPEI